MTMLVLPATLQVNWDQVRQVLHAPDVHLAREKEFAELFPDCDLGAMPPFGNLYNVPVYVDQTLTQDLQIVFNAGTHAEAMRINYQDYARLVQPTVARFGAHVHELVLRF